MFFGINEVTNLITSYFIIYNVSLLPLVVILNNYSSLTFKNNSVLYFISKNKTNNFFIYLSILSVAGVPPLLGFFFKIKLLVVISFISFFKLFLFSFFFLFCSLYFYIQNIRYVIVEKNLNYKIATLNDLKYNVKSLNILLIISSLILFGLIFLNEFNLLISFLNSL